MRIKIYSGIPWFSLRHRGFLVIHSFIYSIHSGRPTQTIFFYSSFFLFFFLNVCLRSSVHRFFGKYPAMDDYRSAICSEVIFDWFRNQRSIRTGRQWASCVSLFHSEIWDGSGEERVLVAINTGRKIVPIYVASVWYGRSSRRRDIMLLWRKLQRCGLHMPSFSFFLLLYPVYDFIINISCWRLATTIQIQIQPNCRW